MIKQLIMVGIGGGIGSMFRFLVSAITARYFYGTFPFPTFIVNLTGCLLIGLFAGLLSQHPQANNNIRLLLITGFCGGYTTFSAFANENLQLIQQNQTMLALIYSIASIILGVLFVWLGMWATKAI